VRGEASGQVVEVRTAEVIAALSLATDLGIGLPLEHGLHSTLCAMRLGRLLAVDDETAVHAYYGCLLYYVGCTVDAEVAADKFPDGALLTHFNPVIYGAPLEIVAGILRALGGSGPAPVRALRAVGRLPGALSGHKRHIVALCEVAEMLTDALGLPAAIRGQMRYLTERWDGRGGPDGVGGTDIPLPMRLVHVARDATLQHQLGGAEHAARVVGDRAGGGLDPDIARLLAAHAGDVLAFDGEATAWEETLAVEPEPRLALRGEDVERALAAMGDFADLLSPYLVGHSAGVAELAGAAAKRCGWPDPEVVAVRRAGFVHDLGRVAVSAAIWQKPGPLSADEWERVRLHAYHTERVLSRSSFLSPLAPVATAHHERLDGSGYHRGSTVAALPPPARLLAAADCYRAMIEPRPHREALTAARAADALHEQTREGRLDADSVAAVLAAAGHPARPVARPAGLTEREAQVITLLARGLQTKQIARALGISIKTADRHVQNSYAKIGVSTRAAAALFAMQHGLTGWGELPIVGTDRRS
jgi:HD-GYP domain-containing protein (c-di-GMP phosphodiesterase class II)